jgi:signal transduction histidine kinase
MRSDPQFSCDSTDSVPAAGPLAQSLRDRDERLQAIKSLVAQLAHGFNNSLAPLAGYLNLLQEEVKDATAAQQYLHKIEGSMHKAEGILDALLRATHPERHYLPQQTDLAELLQGNTEIWMKGLPASAQIAVEMGLSPCIVRVDRAQWSAVIQHLLRNSQLALTREGTVTVTLRRATLSPSAVEELGLAEPEVVQLVVNDTGCGMTPEVLKRACDPLFTTRPHTNTAGLGLTLVHSVVQLHGGQLLLQSEENAGCRVTIWLPAEPSNQ